MAKKTTKSQMIRDVLGQNPKMKIKDVVAALSEKGVKVTPNLAYLVKSKMRMKKRRQVRKRVAKVMPANHDAVATIRLVKGWAAQVGGLDKLKELVQALRE